MSIIERSSIVTPEGFNQTGVPQGLSYRTLGIPPIVRLITPGKKGKVTYYKVGGWVKGIIKPNTKPYREFTLKRGGQDHMSGSKGGIRCNQNSVFHQK